MKKIYNSSLQGFEIYLSTEQGPKAYWLSKKSSVIIPCRYIGNQIKNLEVRKNIKIFDI